MAITQASLAIRTQATPMHPEATRLWPMAIIQAFPVTQTQVTQTPPTVTRLLSTAMTPASPVILTLPQPRSLVLFHRSQTHAPWAHLFPVPRQLQQRLLPDNKLACCNHGNSRRQGQRKNKWPIRTSRESLWSEPERVYQIVREYEALLPRVSAK